MKQEQLEQYKTKFKYNLKTLGRLAIVQTLYNYLMQIHFKNCILNSNYNINQDILALSNLDTYNYEVNDNLIILDKIYQEKQILTRNADNFIKNYNENSNYNEDYNRDEDSDGLKQNNKINNLNKKIQTENIELEQHNKKINLLAKVNHINNYFSKNLYNYNFDILNFYNTTTEILDQTVNIDTKHHKLLLANIHNNFESLKNIVFDNIKKDNITTLQIPHPLLMSILIAGTCEIVHSDLDFKIVINEFTNIANSLLIDQEIKFVNSVLDKISKKYKN
ncbi:MAG: transcription antitermination factor NusB [Rickettsiales bacterium]